MKIPKAVFCFAAAALALSCAPAYATVQIVSLTPLHPSPQVLGTPVDWLANATDTNPGPLMFQFNVVAPHKSLAMVKDFNSGSENSGTWTSQHFIWVPTALEGGYQIQVVAKDFQTGESDTKTVAYQITPLVTGSSPVVVPTANPLVALFSAPACAKGSLMRVSFEESSKKSAGTFTGWTPCHPPATMTFEIAGMYPSTSYDMFAQTRKAGKVTNGTKVTLSTGPLPSAIPFPTFKTLVKPGPNTDRTDRILLHSITRLGGGTHYPDVATDIYGNVMWYYYTISGTHANLLTRPLPDGTFLSIENGQNWIPNQVAAQLLRKIDLAGNIVRETNTGIIQQQLLALGSVNGGPCAAVPQPPPVGSACLGSFHHEAIESLPNGYTAVLADIEKIFPPGTHGDTSGLPVDVMGDMIIVMDENWQVKWYFDTFEHDGGAPQLDIKRPAVLGEICENGKGGCPPIFLTVTGISPKATDWLHANSIYYWPAPQNGNTTGGDLIWSSRHQDWVMRVDYRDGKGTGNILWRMGPGGDFTINSSDPWPWFSHQHDVGIENNGKGVMTIFDNGNTRLSPPSGPGSSTGGTPGLGGTGCKPSDCHSRGIVVKFDETAKTVTPVLSQDLGHFSTAMGSAQLLSNGSYFFVPTIVLLTATDIVAYDEEIQPAAGAETGTTVLNLRSPEVYRGWQMPSLYEPPTT